MIDEKTYIKELIESEGKRQQEEIQLIASENYISEDVRFALGSRLNNRYSEGMPGYKYYGGQEILETIENEAIDLAKELFHADHANVQPHSGAQANMAVYNAWLEPGDTVLSMCLADGGHLTHGAPVTQSAKFYNFEFYGLDDKGYIDMKDLEEKVKAVQPKIILVGYSAYPRIPDFKAIVELRDKYCPEALLMADMAHVAGLIVAGEHPNPLDAGFNVITSTTHKTLRGARGGLIVSKGKVSNPLKKPEHTLENLPTLIDRSVFPGTQGGPICQNIAGKAIAFAEAQTEEFTLYAKQMKINAKAMAEVFAEHSIEMQTGGTDNHLILFNVKKSFGISGGTAEKILEGIGIIVNKNSLHNDTGTKADPDGIRIGTPTITTRGMKEREAKLLAEYIVNALELRDKPESLQALKDGVAVLAGKFPIP